MSFRLPPLGLGHFTFLELPPVELVKLAARAGYAHVGLRLHPIAPGGLAYPLSSGSSGMAELKTVLADNGITVYDVEAVVIDKGFNPEILEPVLESAARLGAQRLNVCADDEDRGHLIAQFCRTCELAGAHGMGVDIECMAWRGINTLAKCVEVVRVSGAYNAGVLIDALHLSRCGGTPEDVTALPPALIRSAQLCDAPAHAPTDIEGRMKEARSNRLLPGEGELPLTQLASALPASTVLSVEMPMIANDTPDHRAKRIFDATMQLLAQRHSPEY